MNKSIFVNIKMWKARGLLYVFLKKLLKSVEKAGWLPRFLHSPSSLLQFGCNVCFYVYFYYKYIIYVLTTLLGLVGIPSSTFTHLHHLHLIIFGKCIGEGISTVEIPSSWTGSPHITLFLFFLKSSVKWNSCKVKHEFH